MTQEVKTWISRVLAPCQQVDFVEKTNAKPGGGFGFQVDATYDIVGVTNQAKIPKNQVDDRPVLATMKITCKNRQNGDMQVVLLINNDDNNNTQKKQPLVAWKRNKRLGVLWLSDGDKQIPITSCADGTSTVLATLLPTIYPTTSIEMTSSKTSFRMWVPTNQPATRWILCAFLTFIPTFGLGGCYGLYKASTVDKIKSVEKTTAEETVKLPNLINNVVDLGSLSDLDERFAVLCLAAFFLANEVTDPPTNSQGGGYTP